MDIKINGNTYNGVERVRLAKADGTGMYSLSESVIEDMAMGNTVETFHNSIITKITTQIFKGATINNLTLPNLTTITPAQAFIGAKVVEVRLPVITAMSGGSTFISCPNLKKIVFGDKLSSFLQQDLRSCAVLETVVLPYNGVVTIPASNCPFQDSGVAKGTGYVYVPKAQVEAYKADTNWSKYANQIRAIEDYPDIVA